jgi:hypothetical protein
MIYDKMLNVDNMLTKINRHSLFDMSSSWKRARELIEDPEGPFALDSPRDYDGIARASLNTAKELEKDLIKDKRRSSMFNERRERLNTSLMEKFGYSSKKNRIDEMMDGEGDLQIGDKVVLSNTSPPTTSGVYGTIVAINDGYVEIQSRDNERWGQQTSLGGEKYRGKTHRGPISKTLKVGGPEDDWETIMYTESKKKF